MATKKQAKPAKGKTASNKKYDGVELPEGFRSITSGDYGDEWDYASDPVLVGSVTSDVREFETGKGKNKRVSRVITVLDENDGRAYTVWESASLRGFFDLVQRGQRVSVIFKGLREVGKPQPMKDFIGAISEDDMEELEKSTPVRRNPKAGAKKRGGKSAEF
jgi:hypothetical protein